ncbi:MAG: hypothetical protein QOC92_3214, partial [Acidimicrobiaceae bacterium]
VNNVDTNNPDDDTLTGGNGVDSISYSSRFNRTVALNLTEDGVANDGSAAHKDLAGKSVPTEADNIGGDIENITGGDGPNTITGTDADNDLTGGDSNDNIQGNGGDDTLSGGFGQDTMGGGEGRDTLFGGGDQDALDGGNGNDDVEGGAQNDNVNGGAGDDQVDGGDGPTRTDASVPDSDTDVISGGDGSDQVFYGRGSTRPITVTLDGQANDGELASPNRLVENDTVGADVEDVFTGSADDTITGSPSDNELGGGSGNDTIVGNGGNDALFGSDGNDNLNGAGPNGSVHVDGGQGNDTIVIADLSRDEADCGAGTDSVSADARDEIHGDCETVQVTPPAQVVIGTVTVTKSGYVLVRVTCPATEPSCVGVVNIKTKKKIGKIILKLGSPSYRAAGGKVSVVKSTIPPAFRLALGKAKKVAIAVTVTNVNAVTGLSSTKSATKTVNTKVFAPKKKKK